MDVDIVFAIFHFDRKLKNCRYTDPSNSSSVEFKAPSTPATMLKQRSTLSKKYSTLLPKTATMSNEFIIKFRPFDKSRMFLRHCCRFLATMLPFLPVLPTMSNEFFVKFRKDETSFNIVANNGNNVEATFDFVESIVRFLVFDNVALILLHGWVPLRRPP